MRYSVLIIYVLFFSCSKGGKEEKKEFKILPTLELLKDTVDNNGLVEAKAYLRYNPIAYDFQIKNLINNIHYSFDSLISNGKSDFKKKWIPISSDTAYINFRVSYTDSEREIMNHKWLIALKVNFKIDRVHEVDTTYIDTIYTAVRMNVLKKLK